MKWMLAIVFVLGSSAVGLAAPPRNLVTAALVADTTAIAPGKPFTVGLHLEIADGWHVYWINPGDAGAATKLVLKVPDGFSAGSVQFPVPEKLDLPGGLTVYGYEKELLLMAVITPPADLKAAVNVAISADASWCVCNPEECVLGNKSLELNLPVAAGGMPANATLFAGWKARMPISSTEAFSSVQEHGGGGSSGGAMYSTNPGVIFTWRDQLPAGRLEWIPGPCDDLTIKLNSMRTDGHQTAMNLRVDRVTGIPAVDSTVTGILAFYQDGQPPRGVAVALDRRTMMLPLPK